MQNRCACLCSNNFDFTVSSKEIIKQLKWMTIKTRFSYFLGIYMYKFINVPTLQNEFNFTHEIYNHNTRKSCRSNIALPLPKTKFFKRSLLYSGPILWNSLPTDIRNCTVCSILSPVLRIIY